MKRLRALALLFCLCVSAVASADLLPTQAYTTITKTATPSSNSTGTTLWTPASGYRFVLQGCFVSSATAGSVRFQVSSVDIVPPIYLASYGNVTVGGTYAPVYVSAVDATLTYTNVGAMSITCWGYEITP